MDEKDRFEELTRALKDLFGLSNVYGYELLHSGFMSQNYRVNTERGSFFLKRYRDRINTIIHEIKMAEEYFSKNGLPIILPIKDRYNREAFWSDGWYSLFPFVESESPVRPHINTEVISSLATMLAKIHNAGDRFTYRPFQMVRVGNERKFHMESVELRRKLQSRNQLTKEEQQIEELLALKTQLTKKAGRGPDRFQVNFNCLLHGDFQHFNVFASSTAVTHIFDLERSALGFAPYELARAIFMDCFEDGWEETNFNDARHYFRTYHEYRAITLDDFSEAIQYYYYNIIHTSWIEANYLVYGMHQSLAVLERQQKRIQYLSSHDLPMLAKEIWQ